MFTVCLQPWIRRTRWAVVVALVAMTPPVGALPAIGTVTVSGNKILVNGKPFFPLIMYNAGHWHHGIIPTAAKGYTVTFAYGSTPADFVTDLDNMSRHGMYGLVSFNGFTSDLTFVQSVVNATKTHPALLGYSIEDEPNILYNGVYRILPSQLSPAYQRIKQLDANHPVFLNLVGGYITDFQNFAACTDIFSNDVYPVPSSDLPAVAAYVDNCRTGSGSKPIWHITQLSPIHPDLGASDRAPTITEMRCMSYMAIVHGATGLGYYAYYCYETNWWADVNGTALWNQTAGLTAELRALEPLILTSEYPTPVTVTLNPPVPSPPYPWNYQPLHVSLRKADGMYLLIAVNGLKTTVNATLTLPTGLTAGIQATVMSESRQVNITNSAITDSFAPYAVHVYGIPFTFTDAFDAGPDLSLNLNLWSQYKLRRKPDMSYEIDPAGANWRTYGGWAGQSMSGSGNWFYAVVRPNIFKIYSNDFTIKAICGANSWEVVGLIFGWQNELNFYRAEIQSWSDGLGSVLYNPGIRVVKYANGVETELVRQNLPASWPKADGTVAGMPVLTVRGQNQSFTVTLSRADQSPVSVSVSDSTYSNGQVGMYGGGIGPYADFWDFTATTYAGLRTVSGTLSLQDYDSSKVSGTSAVVTINSPTTGDTLDTRTVVLGSGGSFSLDTTLAAGTYTLTAKAEHWLRQSLSAPIPGPVSFSLANGDVNGDNAVNETDLSAVMAKMDLAGSGDLDGDNQTTSTDLSIVLKNFSLAGN